ncbi:uncharacterized protein B0I36DRAFT_364435 [Microdochium trichocladiopsis]|uniref:Uncharacterized protein n=1 Tax=Microdochium trichocladiopsis TaxID=1682393 RepID=A0A9P8XZV4_9PEZI|nr:uncharacterized protein B0I36DRAFT_364435 [Microdochium trichocladiopsis]KAH7027193.1 hypothetical protein B0I36DRAFT_364435 [Microdochium trichocladiopsis]
MFLQWYVKNSERWEVCLGPEDRQWKRVVKSAITIDEIWKRLVVGADETVLLKKRKSDRENRGKWRLAFKEKDKTGPVADISRWIAGPMAEKYKLTLEQTFVKQQATAEDIAVWLITLWTRSGDIDISPAKRVAFHVYVLLAGITGFRNSSLFGLPYSQVRFSLVRDPDDRRNSRLVAHILIIHSKRIQRNQDNKIEFSITFVPCRVFCLLSQLVARAIADDAFEAGY